MIRFYFAHPTTMYDTPVEGEIAKKFEQRFPGTRVENPNQPHHCDGYKEGGMGYFVDLCNQLDGVFFSPFADGTLGAGVAREVQSFLDRDAPVFLYDQKTQDFVPVKDLSTFSVLSVDDTRARLNEERCQITRGDSPYQSLHRYAVDVKA